MCVCVFHEINLCANEIVFIVCRQHRTEEWEILQPISYTCVLLKKNLYRNVFFSWFLAVLLSMLKVIVSYLYTL